MIISSRKIILARNLNFSWQCCRQNINQNDKLPLRESEINRCIIICWVGIHRIVFRGSWKMCWDGIWGKGKHKQLNATKASLLCIQAPFCITNTESQGSNDDVIKGDTLEHEFDSNLFNAFCVIHTSQKHYSLRITAVEVVCHIYYPTLGIFCCAFWSVLQPLRAVCRAIFLLQEVSSKGNIHKRVFITLVSKKKCHESVVVAWGLWQEEKRQILTMEKCFRQEPVPRRTKQTMFAAPALAP